MVQNEEIGCSASVLPEEEWIAVHERSKSPAPRPGNS